MAAYSARLSSRPFLCRCRAPHPPTTKTTTTVLRPWLLSTLPDRDLTERKRGLAAGMKAHRNYVPTQISVLCCHSSGPRMIPSTLSLQGHWSMLSHTASFSPRRDHRPLPASCKSQGCMLRTCHVPSSTGGVRWAASQELEEFWPQCATLAHFKLLSSSLRYVRRDRASARQKTCLTYQKPAPGSGSSMPRRAMKNRDLGSEPPTLHRHPRVFAVAIEMIRMEMWPPKRF